MIRSSLFQGFVLRCGIWHLSTHTYAVSEIIPFSTKPLLILLKSAFLAKKSAFFWRKLYLYSKKWCWSCLRDFLFSVFARLKVTINDNISFTDYAPKIQLPDCYKLAVNWKNANDVTIPDMTPSSTFLRLFCFSCQAQLLVQVLCQYHLWFWSYGTFL